VVFHFSCKDSDTDRSEKGYAFRHWINLLSGIKVRVNAEMGYSRIAVLPEGKREKGFVRVFCLQEGNTGSKREQTGARRMYIGASRL